MNQNTAAMVICAGATANLLNRAFAAKSVPKLFTATRASLWITEGRPQGLSYSFPISNWAVNRM